MNADTVLPPTLRQIRDQGFLSRGVVMAARQHVGAAGIEQTSALERVIAVGQGQPSIVRALEGMARSLKSKHSGTSVAETQELLETTQEQLQAVQLLGEIVTDALQMVRDTPIDRISVAVLTEINLGAREQLVSLEQLVQEVQQRTTSESQAQLLQQVEQEVHEALEAIEVQGAHGQVEALGLAGKEAVAQIAALDLAPTGHQIAALEGVAASALEQAEALRLQAAADQS